MPKPFVRIHHLVSDEQCYDTIRDLRWPDGVRCPHCDSENTIKRGRDDTQPARQRYECKSCNKRFDDLTDSVLAGHHQPLRNWILCLYFMGLNLSNQQIGEELDINKDDVQQMASQLRNGIVKKNLK
jgi:transposase-like protein